MKNFVVSRKFIKDFASIANIYKWTSDDIEEMKQCVRVDPGMRKYLEVLAAAHRAGYSQHAGNGFVRLQQWCIEKGFGDPYGPEFDPAALDELEFKERVI